MLEQLISLNVTADCSLLSDTEPTTRLLRVTVKAADVPRKTERMPLNLALVLDRSGSMDNGKIEYAKRALSHVLDLLGASDTASVVIYDTEIDVLAPSQHVTDSARRSMQARLNGVHPRGGTALCDGWLRGATEATTAFMERGINRVLLFTDGLANHGETRTDVIAQHASNLRMRGLSTSTFGVGLDYNHDLLEQMATQGGGQYHFIETPNQIPEMFARELNELLTIAARRMEITLKTPANVEMKLLGGLSHETSAGKLSIPVGDLCAGRSIEYFIEVQTSARTAGSEVPFSITAEWYDEEAQEQKLKEMFAFFYATHREVQNASQDWELQQQAGLMRVAEAEAEAYRHQREGRYDKSATVLRAAVSQNQSFMPQADFMELFSLADRMEQNAVPAPEQKRRHYDSHQRAHRRVKHEEQLREEEILPPHIPAFEYSHVTHRLLAGRNPLTAGDVAKLKAEGVTHIVDLREPVEWTHPRLGENALHALNQSGIHRLHLPIADATAPKPEDFQNAVTHLMDILAQGNTKVYVHCRAGQGRTAAILMAYLAHTQNISCEDALKVLRRGRKTLAPEPGQAKAAQMWCDQCRR